MILTGVTVLLFPPEVDDVNNTLPGVEELPPNVTPADAMSSRNPNKIGFSFTLSTDKSVTRYGMYESWPVRSNSVWLI